MKVNVAAVQFEPTMFEKDYNIKRLLQLVEEAAINGAQLITVPEMATTGYCWYNREEVEPYVEPIPGTTTSKFEQLASKYNCYIVIGMPEVDVETDLYYNSAVLIGPKGIIGVHRKTHPYISEPKWATSGDLGHQVYDTPIGKIGLLICMDIHYVETARIMGVQNVDVICHISNWLAERTPAPYWITRAYENDAYLIESNRWGLERGVQFSGGSCIINPDGTIQQVLDAGDGIVYGKIETKRRKWLDRKPIYYKELTLDSYRWDPQTFFNLYDAQKIPPGKKSKVAVVNLSANEIANLDVLATIKDIIQTEVSNGAELIVFPEKVLGPIAVSIDDSLFNEIVKMTIQYKCYCVLGFIESSKDDLYNSAAVIGPYGIEKIYRQMHVADESVYAAGEEWCVVDTHLGRVGVLIGEDLKYPESARILAIRGCDIICVCAQIEDSLVLDHPGTSVSQNYPIPVNADPYHWHLARTRAGENNVYLAFANSKVSGIFGPETLSSLEQKVLSQLEELQFLTSTHPALICRFAVKTCCQCASHCNTKY